MQNDLCGASTFCILPLSLTLLMLRVVADDADNTIAPDDPALIAHSLYRRSNLHAAFLPTRRPRKLSLPDRAANGI
jgi:hypothetical protein